MAVLVATGISAHGPREVLELDVGDSEDEVFWRWFLRSLRHRGLGGVKLAISDQHAGLVAALKRAFKGRSTQRCRGHFARNLLALGLKTHQDMVAAVFRTIFAQPAPDTVSATWAQVRDQVAKNFPKIAPLIDSAKTEVLAFTGFPRSHWVKSGYRTRSSGSTRESGAAAASWASSRSKQPSSPSSARSSRTCTTNGKPATAAISTTTQRRSSTPRATMTPSQNSNPAAEHRGSTSKARHSAGATSSTCIRAQEEVTWPLS
jgi:hypothetical protein